MVRDAQATKRRLLEAASTEFAERGIAGARVDRIAAHAGSNKAQIYTYFGSKDALFDAVFDEMVIATVESVPIDPDHLPEYAGRLFDHAIEHPGQLRIVLWDQLERQGKGIRSLEVQGAAARKGEAIRAAQRSGLVAKHLPADLLHQVIGIVTTQAAFQLQAEASAAQRAELRASVVEITRLLTHP
ncbi:AcrR family transcriptional regulator [Psychromicrobium silvestre]|uniref:AcrR family transcriptional regulator n=1 Tax=Psychromicrobium silvestre TaxID=1645614 RepID=A0A7Y9S7I1_9MICC|nr:TetR family transcriptional regulator [Psychromicrobium silvestre]NYE95121.1 AcrR family transcriptional regulator [Psychromicrobium silvestre]